MLILAFKVNSTASLNCTFFSNFFYPTFSILPQFLDSFEESKKQEIERCDEIQQKIEELASQMGESLESVGTENLPSRSDFVSMKEDLAFRFVKKSGKHSRI